MMTLFTVILMPSALVLAVYYWSEWQDAKKHTRHVTAGYKAARTRRLNSHTVKVYDWSTDTNNYFSLKGN